MTSNINQKIRIVTKILWIVCFATLSTLVFASDVVNVSTRGLTGTEDDRMIVGFSIKGNDDKKIIAGAVGTTLSDSDVSNVLVDPKISIANAAGDIIATNSQWGDDEEVAATTYSALNSELEPVIVLTLSPGAYTLIVEGENGETGNALPFVENYGNALPDDGGILGDWSGTSYLNYGVDGLCVGNILMQVASSSYTVTGSYRTGTSTVLNCEVELNALFERTYTYTPPYLITSSGIFIAIKDGDKLNIVNVPDTRLGDTGVTEMYMMSRVAR